MTDPIPEFRRLRAEHERVRQELIHRIQIRLRELESLHRDAQNAGHGELSALSRELGWYPVAPSDEDEK